MVPWEPELVKSRRACNNLLFPCIPSRLYCTYFKQPHSSSLVTTQPLKRACVQRQGKGEEKGGGSLCKEGRHCTEERHSWKGLCSGFMLPISSLVSQPFALPGHAGHFQHPYVPTVVSRLAGMRWLHQASLSLRDMLQGLPRGPGVKFSPGTGSAKINTQIFF